MGHLQENIVETQIKFYLDEIMEYYGLKLILLINDKKSGYVLRKISSEQVDFNIHINDILKEMERKT